MSAGPEWGPLARLAGIWEGERGEDVAYANETGKIGLTPYREHVDFKPFGPVENGPQVLYGLDYRMAAWRGDEENPFHTEVGYWLWDARDSEVVRCFIIPRGSADRRRRHGRPPTPPPSRSRPRSASRPTASWPNNWLDKNARVGPLRGDHRHQRATNEFTYSETTVIKHAKVAEEVIHTDRNTLQADRRRLGRPGRVDPAGARRGRRRHVMFEWSEEQLAIRDAVRRFVEEEVKPNVEELEHGDTPPYEVIRKLYRTFGLDATGPGLLQAGARAQDVGHGGAGAVRGRRQRRA